MLQPKLCRAVLTSCLVALLPVCRFQAATIGFWTFEDYAGQAAVPALGMIQDTSGNARHLLDRPGRRVVPGAAPGSTALEFSGTLRDVLEFRPGFSDFSNSDATAAGTDIVLGQDDSLTIEAVATLPHDNLYVTEGGILGKGGYSVAAGSDEWNMVAINNSNSHTNTVEAFLGDGGHPAGGFYIKHNETDLAPGWHHLALVRNRQTDEVSFYVDGTLIGTQLDQNGLVKMDLSNAPGNFVIGGNNSLPRKPFRGSIDMVRISDEALPSSEFFMTAGEPGSLESESGRPNTDDRRPHSPSSALPPGFVDASTFGYNATDATAALQAAINTGSNVWVPNMGSDWIVTPIFLTQNDQTIRFEEGVVVAAKPGAFLGHDYLFRNVTRASVRLEGYGATFRMRQQDYLAPPYTPSEFRFGISCHAANGFEIVGLTIEDTGGDGIYIGNTSGDFSRNILVKDVTINNAFRNGISIIAASNVVIENTVIVNTSGHAPQAGIDFEPNYPDERIENVTIRDTVVAGNFGAGIVWSLHDTPAIPPVSGTLKNVTVIGNGTKGLWLLEGALPGWSIGDTLVVENFEEGFFVGGDCDPAETDCAAGHGIGYSALWDNKGGPFGGTAVPGAGSMTNREPDFVSSFVSTGLNDPYFMYLEPGAPAAISGGASDGRHIGARPVLHSGDGAGAGMSFAIR